MNAKLPQTCEAFIEAVYDAKERSTPQDDIYADEAANKAYSRRFKTVDSVTPKEVEWRAGVRDHQHRG